MNMLKLIAERAGVSPSTVSRILNGKRKGAWSTRSEKTALIKNIAKELNYRPSAASRMIRQNRGRNIGVLLPSMESAEWASSIINGLNGELVSQKYIASVLSVASLAEAGTMPIFKERLFDAVVAVSFNKIAEDFRLFIESISPICLWVESDTWKEMNCARFDFRHAGRLAAEMAVSKGYSRLVFADIDKWPEAGFSVYERFDGAMEAAGAMGVELRQIRLVTLPGRLTEFEARIACAMKPGTAIICWSPDIAQWCARVAMKRRLITGTDFGLVCADDAERVKSFWPELTRVSCDRLLLGAEVAMRLERLLSGDGEGFESFKIKGEPIVGSTL